MSKVISIIVPVYNVEQYLEHCIRSCENQNLSPESYEIIAVNDGSTDNSLKVLENLASEYDNIRIITQDNMGLSMARNNGLKDAQGNFVWFVDSDDWIEQDCLKRLISKFSDKTDIVQLRYRYTYDNPEENKDFASIYYEDEKSGKWMTLHGGLTAPVPYCIYRREFLISNNLYFVKGLLHEDSEFKPKAVYLARGIAFDNIVSYNYYQRTSGSITSHFSLKHVTAYIQVNNNLADFFNKLEEKYRSAMYNYVSLNMNTVLLGYREMQDSEKQDTIHLLKENKRLFYYMFRSNRLKYKLEGLSFLINIRLGFWLHGCIR